MGDDMGNAIGGMVGGVVTLGLGLAAIRMVDRIGNPESRYSRKRKLRRKHSVRLF